MYKVVWRGNALQAAGLVGAEALAQHLVGVIDDDEGVGVHLLHPLFQLDDLVFAEGAEDHLPRLMGIAALAAEQGDAPVHVQQRGGQLLVVVGHDARHLGALAAVHHPIHDEGDQVQRRHGVQATAQVVERQRVQHHDQPVQQAAQRTDGHALQPQPQQPRRQIGAAHGGGLPQHQAAAGTHQHSAVHAGQHRLDGRERHELIQKVDEQGADQHGIQRGHQPVPSHLLPDQEEQRQVHQQYLHAHGELRNKQSDHLRKAGEAAHAHLVGGIEPAEAQRIQRAPQCDLGKAQQRVTKSVPHAANLQV